MPSIVQLLLVGRACSTLLMVECASRGKHMVRIVLRDKGYEVKAGMTLLSALENVRILPETVLATGDGELILDDEILRDGEDVRLVAVISGG